MSNELVPKEATKNVFAKLFEYKGSQLLATLHNVGYDDLNEGEEAFGEDGKVLKKKITFEWQGNTEVIGKVSIGNDAETIDTLFRELDETKAVEIMDELGVFTLIDYLTTEDEHTKAD